MILAIAIAWAVAGSPLGAEETAFGALDAFLDSEKRASAEVVLGMVGFYGEPAPPQWLVLTASRPDAKVLRESVVSGGALRAEREFRRLPGQDLPAIAIDRSVLRIDSSAAFRIAAEVAEKNRIGFDSIHYQLRCREEKQEPVWMLNLIGPAQVSRGVIYLSAVSGDVLRVSWIRPEIESFASDRSDG